MSVKTAIVANWKGGMKHLYGKNRPVKPGSRLGDTGRKTSLLHITACNKNYRNIYMSASRVSSRPGKRRVPPLI